MDRLRQRADFLAAAQGPRVNSPAFVVQHCRREDDGAIRVGFTVSKKVGNAPQRNRARRRLRAVLKLVGPQAMAAHSDYVIVGRSAALSRDFDDMRLDLVNALKRLATPPAPRR